MAVVDPLSQLTSGFDTQCPYTNGSIQFANGVNFTVYCGLDEPYNDYCPGSAESLCPVHMESLSDCMAYCSQSHPLCAGVSWNPDLLNGYGNCYPKNAPPNSYGFYVSEGDGSTGQSFWVHTAIANIVNGSDITVDCSDQAQIMALNGNTFITSCNREMADNNLTISHEASIQDCIDTCASAVDGTCLGVVYDTQLTNGWQNCYLKNATAPIVDSTSGSTVALLTSDGKTPLSSAPASGEGGSPPKSKAWIAGPIAGGVALISILITALMLVRRRKSRRRAAAVAAQNQGYYYTAGKVELDGREHRPVPTELEAWKSPIEMEASAPPIELEGDVRRQSRKLDR
ncbi:MAG: hypothetical protein Q9165_000994 [Trypethelium subeluteriae]